ncbi:MAG: hypothetical protein ABI675_13465 [Chitinophagaceae bacterium]
MKQESDIEKRVEDALNSLDGIQRAAPQPWLFSRVKGRLLRQEEKTKWETIGSFLSKPAVAIAGLLLILGLNGVLLFNQQSGSSVVVQNELQPNDSESLLASSSNFDYENLVQP